MKCFHDEYHAGGFFCRECLVVLCDFSPCLGAEICSRRRRRPSGCRRRLPACPSVSRGRECPGGRRARDGATERDKDAEKNDGGSKEVSNSADLFAKRAHRKQALLTEKDNELEGKYEC